MRIIKPPVRDPSGFLQRHIHRDLEQLAKTLGRSADEATTTVHLMLCSLLRGQGRLSSWSEHMGRRGGQGQGSQSLSQIKGAGRRVWKSRRKDGSPLRFPCGLRPELAGSCAQGC